MRRQGSGRNRKLPMPLNLGVAEVLPGSAFPEPASRSLCPTSWGVCEVRHIAGQIISGSSCPVRTSPLHPGTRDPALWAAMQDWVAPRIALLWQLFSACYWSSYFQGPSSSLSFMFSFPLMLLFYQRQISRPGHLTVIRKGSIFFITSKKEGLVWIYCFSTLWHFSA